MTLLSITAVSRLAERHVRTYGPQPRADVIRWLERHGIDEERAERGVEFALIRNRLKRATRDDGEALLAGTTWPREAAA
jgi:hypothetical protein